MTTTYESRPEARRIAADDLTCRNCGHLASAHVPDQHGWTWCPTTAQLVAQLRAWQRVERASEEAIR